MPMPTSISLEAKTRAQAGRIERSTEVDEHVYIATAQFDPQLDNKVKHDERSTEVDKQIDEARPKAGTSCTLC